MLCNSMLNNLATYYMCSYLLPRGVIESIDKRRRAFLWTGKDTCSGARCLIAWENVLLSTQEGGFGVKDLHRQNRCLLLNFIHKLHQPERLPWIDWYRRDGRDLGDVSSSPSFLDKIVLECLPLYRAMTRCVVVSVTSTAFWLDRWLRGAAWRTGFPPYSPTAPGRTLRWRGSPPTVSPFNLVSLERPPLSSWMSASSLMGSLSWMGRIGATSTRPQLRRSPLVRRTVGSPRLAQWIRRLVSFGRPDCPRK